MQKGLLQPLPNPNPPNPNTSDYNPNKYCKFHQNLKHSTDSCMHLKYEIQNLIDFEKITDPENPNQNTKNNPFLNYPNIPPPATIVTSSGISKEESPDAFKNEEKIKKPTALSCSPREIENEKKKNTQNTGTRNYPTGGTQQENTSRAVEVHVVQQSRRF